MDLFASQFDGSLVSQPSVTSSIDLNAELKTHSKADIHNALTLLGFASWKSVESGNTFYYSTALINILQPLFVIIIFKPNM